MHEVITQPWAAGAEATAAPADARRQRRRPPTGLPSGPRVALALRAACDITEVLSVIAGMDPDNDPQPAVLQMVQQRVHDLTCGILAALSDQHDTVVEIQGRLYPSEPESGGVHA